MAIAALLAATAAALLLYVFTANAHSFALRSRDAGLQTAAFVESELALKTCAADGGAGAARCENGVVFVNEIEKLPENLETRKTSAENENTETESAACVTRIVLFQGAQRAVQYCATETPAEGVK